MSIHPQTEIGRVHLEVSDLERSLNFYTELIGFQHLEGADGAATLSADGKTPLLMLTERPGARPRPRNTTGLYHFAILLPSRADLGHSLRRLIEAGYPLGSSDHLVSEALYLDDPDANGIEIYRDRPRSEWRWQDGAVAMANDPLDFEGILAAAESDGRAWQGLPARTRIGHIHLHVGDIAGAEAFYSGVLGFDVVARLAGSALFISAGGYHHHIGLNTWAGQGAPRPPAGSAGLRYYTVEVPGAAELERLTSELERAAHPVVRETGSVSLEDPWGNGIRLVDKEAARLPEEARAGDRQAT